MAHPEGTADPARQPHIVVHSPALDGSRRVTEGEETLGIATHADDVAEILRLADLYVTDVEGSELIEWQGGGPDDWPGLSEHHEPPAADTTEDVERLRNPQINL
ncbi:hypothetical protein [Streptomyces sp. NBC_00588]|uniref:hypothetical protein n=1 Tax=Streptomyces sp. NBC_00588 TaxID=2975784 RepID=UPI002E80F16C|nr:hypothetical protein [Streptomyces sp. NBC_00588]WUB35108.1 hypothetical protein OHN38_09380 [Streptomyces sp. NBC_00588]